MRLLARFLHGFRDQRPRSSCCGRTWERVLEHRIFAHGEQLARVPCSECGAPSVGWRYATLDDGIAGESVCIAHLAGVAA